MPPLFQWLQQAGNVDAQEMYRVFNCGIGMVVIENRRDVGAASHALGKTVSVRAMRPVDVAPRRASLLWSQRSLSTSADELLQITPGHRDAFPAFTLGPLWLPAIAA